MGTIRKFMLAVVCASLSSLAAAQVYKWVDGRGVTHYGQRPPSAQSGVRTLREPPPPAAAAPETHASPTSIASRPAKSGGSAAAFASCESRACASVRRVDPQCRSSLCTEALALPNECSTIACQGRRSDLEKRVAKRQRAGEAGSRANPSTRDFVATRRSTSKSPSTAQAIARCKESRGINCDDPKIAAQWARQDQPITDPERKQAINARRQRSMCAGARGALGC